MNDGSQRSASATAWLDQPLRTVIGGATAKALAALDLHTAGDLLDHFPRRYGEHGQLTDMASLQVGEQVTVFAEIASVASRGMRQRKGTITEVVVTDGKHHLSLTFFNQAWRERQLEVGMRGLFAGTVSVHARKRQLTQPDLQIFGPATGDADRRLEDDPETAAAGAIEGLEAFTDRLIRIYPASAKLPTWRIQKAVDVLLDTMPELPDPVPPDVVAREGLMSLTQAYQTIHRPCTRADVEAARRRLAYQEALILQTVLARRRAAWEASRSTPRVPQADGLLTDFDARLPFTLTAGQQSVTAEVAADLARSHPMHRLIQGEVGSGKTVVALRAMLAVVDAGGQAALLAPTEVLAQQHHRTITAMLGPLAEGGQLGAPAQATRVRLLTGSLPAAARRQALLDVASGDAGIVIGTHALLQEHVDFFDLGLVVVDEQHRFGVEQREALRAKADSPPHVLVMTATPIPRTVAMTIFGDLDISTLTELPQGRQAIATHVVPVAERPRFLERTWERVAEEVAQGRQAYVVCAQIGDELDAVPVPPPLPGSLREPDPGGWLRAPSVLGLAQTLRQGPLAGYRVEVLHGQLPSDVKDQVMTRFAAGKIDVLVATTVIEVGVDVPNATVMVVMDAERFGVSQLHQIRGRVGRGDHPGLCLLVTEQTGNTPGRRRIDAVARTVDGFALARIDLEQRREGDVLGTAQSGRRSSLKILRVIADEEVITRARSDAAEIVAASPELAEHPALREAVLRQEDDEQSEYLEKA